MRRLLSTVSLSVVCLTACDSKPAPAPTTPPAGPDDPSTQVENLLLVANHWPPYTTDSGGPRVALDLVEKAMGRVGYAVTFEITPGASDLEAERYDGSPALWRDEHRESYMLYSDPYFQNRLVLVARKGGDVGVASLAELARKHGGAKVGLVKGYAYGDEVLGAEGLELVEQTTNADNLRSLMAGELDYVLIDEVLAQHLMQRQPEKAAAAVSVGRNAITTRSLHLGIKRSREDAEEIVAKFNELIPNLIADGSYHNALKVRWIIADVDGDGTEEFTLLGDAAGEMPPAYALRPVGAPETDPNAHVGFFVDGKRYEDWDSVPEMYKVPTPAEQYWEGAGTANLIEFRF